MKTRKRGVELEDGTHVPIFKLSSSRDADAVPLPEIIRDTTGGFPKSFKYRDQ